MSETTELDVRRSVVETAMEMFTTGLVVGTAGNVSGRRADGSVAMTPSSVPYPDITAGGLAIVDLEGEIVEGSARPSSEKAMHLACYRAFPEVGGVVHCHPAHGSMFAVARRPIPACPVDHGPPARTDPGRIPQSCRSGRGPSPGWWYSYPGPKTTRVHP